MSRTGVMLPSVVGAVAATSCQVQERFPRAYLVSALGWDSGACTAAASSGTASRVGTSESLRGSARPSLLLLFLDVLLCMVWVCAPAFTAYAAAASSCFAKRKSVSSFHIRCSTTPIRRASATVARFFPRRLATFSAHVRSQLGRPRCSITVAAW